MAKNNDQDAQRAAVREAHRQGVSPSEAGATTGASKQREHVRKGEARHENSSAQGKSKTGSGAADEFDGRGGSLLLTGEEADPWPTTRRRSAS